MSDGTTPLSPRVEHNTVRSRRTTRVRRPTGQDRELLVRSADGKAEPLTIVVLVWVVARPDLLAVGVVVVALVDGRGDLRGGIVLVATVGGLLADLELCRLSDGGGEGGCGEEEGGGEEGETHGGRFGGWSGWAGLVLGI